MGRNRWIWICVAGLWLSASVGAQTRKERQEAIKAYVGELLDRHEFKIDVSKAYPMKGGSISLTTLYNLEMRGDSANVYLPYFGRAYSVPYGGGKGLNFRSGVKNFSMEKKKKHYELKFTSDTDEDTYDFFIEINEDGGASIWVTMRNRQSIGFSGKMNVSGMEKRTGHDGE